MINSGMPGVLDVDLFSIYKKRDPRVPLRRGDELYLKCAFFNVCVNKNHVFENRFAH